MMLPWSRLPRGLIRPAGGAGARTEPGTTQHAPRPLPRPELIAPARLGAQAALAREREAAGGEAAGAERGVADARFRLRILDRRLRANEEHALGRFQALVARLAADARLASLREPG